MKKARCKLKAIFSIYIVFICLFIGYPVAGVQINENEKYERCELILSTLQLDALNRLFLQLSSILDKVIVNITNRQAIEEIRRIISGWMSRERVFSIEDLLQIAHFLDIEPSVFLSTPNLQDQVRIFVIEKRSFMLNTVLQRRLRYINQGLRNRIADLTSAFSIKFDNSNFSSSDLASIIGVPREELDKINSSYYVPHYLYTQQILNAGNYDDIKVSIVDFFKEREKGIRTGQDKNLEQNRPRRRYIFTLEEENTLRSMGKYLVNMIDQRQANHRDDIFWFLNFNRDTLKTKPINFYMSSLIATHYVTRYSVPDVIAKRLLTEEDAAQLPEVRTVRDDDMKAYIDKSSIVIAYLVKSQMQHLGLSIRSLSLKAGVFYKTIYEFLRRKKSLMYLNLLKIVEDGFEIPLEDFLAGDNVTSLSLEQLIEQFDSFNFDGLDILIEHIVYNNTDEVYRKYVESFNTRTSEISNTMRATNIPFKKRRAILGIDHDIWNPTPLTRLATLIRVAHFFNIDLVMLLLTYENLSSLQAVNLERLSNEAIQINLNTLAENIQKEMEIRNLSLDDLHVQSGVNPVHDLEPILNGQMTTTYSQLLNVCRGLLQPDEDPFALLERLLNGVSTL